MNFNQAKKINLKQKIATNSLLFVLVFSAIFYFAIFAGSKKIKELRGQIIAEKIEIEKRISREENLSNLAVKLKRIEGELEKIDGVFIEKSNQLDFITTLEDIANYNNVTQTINLLPVTSATSVVAKSLININAKGRYIDTVNYLKDIESLSYYINIDTISFSQSNPLEEDPESLVSLNLTANTYWK